MLGRKENVNTFSSNIFSYFQTLEVTYVALFRTVRYDKLYKDFKSQLGLLKHSIFIKINSSFVSTTIISENHTSL